MARGFIFNHNKCVDCNACSAACILENGWSVHTRKIYTYNSGAVDLLPLINLSLACNHCESAVCMDGCPTSAYSRDKATGAILLDEKRCIGCRYCQWNCPYDAPKFDSEKKIIAKCNLCNPGLIEGRQPACSSACPTGALGFGQLPDFDPAEGYSWFPDKKLNPAIGFTAGNDHSHLRTIPENIFGGSDSKPGRKGKSILPELSLVIFSFFSTISVSTIISSSVSGEFPEKMIFIPVIVLAGFTSFFHLGRKLRSWRSVRNLKNSPLSREIAAFIVYTIVFLFAVYFRIPAFLIASSITGLILLLLIDSVYLYSDRRKSVILHSGQTFISALLIVSFISGIVPAFIFMGIVKLVLTVYNLDIKKRNGNNVGIRFLRIALLIVPGFSLIRYSVFPAADIIFIFLLGELLDRILFYIDFNPLNINTLIDEQLKIGRDEKERG